MKTEIEKKLGCSIEQFMERKQREWKWAADNDMEIDGPSGLGFFAKQNRAYNLTVSPRRLRLEPPISMR